MGKNIQLYLHDSNSDGVITSSLGNWSANVIKIPRTKVKCSDVEVEGFSLPGLYFLISDDKNIYIGESKDVKSRLIQHINNYDKNLFKDNTKEDTFYWATCICFTDTKLEKSHTKYLEHLACAKFNFGNYNLLTQRSDVQNLSRGKEDELNQFFDNIDLFMNILGYGNIFLKDDCFSNETTFICNKRNSNATGHLSSGGFTVKKGSLVSNNVTEAFETDSRYRLRKSLEENGTIKNKTFNIDYEFTSPSSASSVVMGMSSNGKKDWKTKEGITLGEYNNSPKQQ